MKLRGIIFDMDGTLADTLPVIIPALQETFRRYAGREYSAEEIYAMFGPTEEGVIQRRVPAGDYPAALRFYLDRYAAYHDSACQPFPGVIPMLDRLRAGGTRLGVVTGKGPGTAAITMRALDLEGRIETLETGSNAGGIKADAIRRVLAAWDMPPEHAAYVGDVPYDMEAAREAGVLPVAAAWAETATVRPGDGDLAFHSVEAFAHWIEDQG